MAKYNFQLLKNDCLRNHSPLPEDVNAQPEESAARYGDPELDAEMLKWRKDKLFGRIDYAGRHASGLPYVVASFLFDYGICTQYYKTQEIGNVIATRSIFNELVDKKKIKPITQNEEK